MDSSDSLPCVRAALLFHWNANCIVIRTINKHLENIVSCHSNSFYKTPFAYFGITAQIFHCNHFYDQLKLISTWHVFATVNSKRFPVIEYCFRVKYACPWPLTGEILNNASDLDFGVRTPCPLFAADVLLPERLKGVYLQH